MLLQKSELATKLGRQIRVLRVARKMTMEDLAIDAGIEYAQLSRIEHGKINTSVYQVYLISKALHCELSEIVQPIDSGNLHTSGSDNAS